MKQIEAGARRDVSVAGDSGQRLGDDSRGARSRRAFGGTR